MFVILRFSELVFACALFYNKLTMTHLRSQWAAYKSLHVDIQYILVAAIFKLFLFASFFQARLHLKIDPKDGWPSSSMPRPSMASLCDMQVALMPSVQSVLAVQSEHTKSLVDLIIKVDKVIDLIKQKTSIESAETSKDEPTIKREPERDLFPEEKMAKRARK